MSDTLLLKNAQLISENKNITRDVLIKNGLIERIDSHISNDANIKEIPCDGRILIPGVIDDQVHFRQPGLTHKADIASESLAAIMGGVTSFMEMPNTNPATFTSELLEEKYAIAKESSYANYSFFLGASNDNIEEIKKLDINHNCGVKIFMGSSTGNLLVDKEEVLSQIFQYSPTLIATHCEEEALVLANKEKYKEEAYRTHDPKLHAIIRDREACIVSSQKAIALAKKYQSRLHILHISTAEEVLLFDNTIPLKDKKITSEACVHHLWFSSEDYATYGNQIVCNPAIKESSDREAILRGLLDHHIDIIATDHAPHTWEEKSGLYPDIPSGVPLVQHSLLMMLEYVKEGKMTLEQLVEKMCHAPADCFNIKNRGYIKEGYYADLVLINPLQSTTVTKENLQYKCKWSPFEGKTFSHSIDMTILNGKIAQMNGTPLLNVRNGMRLEFEHCF